MFMTKEQRKEFIRQKLASPEIQKAMNKGYTVKSYRLINGEWVFVGKMIENSHQRAAKAKRDRESDK